MMFVVVVQLLSHVWLCHSMNYTMPGFFILHYFPKLAQTHIHLISDIIQPSYPLSPPSPPALTFPESGSFPMIWLFPSGGQSIGVSASTSGLLLSIYSWFPLGLTGLIFLLSKGLSRVFSITTVWKQTFFGVSTLTSMVAQIVKTLPTRRRPGFNPWVGEIPWIRKEGNGYPLWYSSLKNPWTEESGGLQSVGSQRVGHVWATNTLTSLHDYWKNPYLWPHGPLLAKHVSAF